MKKLFSFLAIIGLIFASNCSRIPENNDPVIGIWSKVDIKEATQTSKKSTVRQEWIFNDAYLGRFHRYNNTNLEVITDFKWNEEDGTYTITYPGLPEKPDHFVSMDEKEGDTVLELTDGSILAKRE